MTDPRKPGLPKDDLLDGERELHSVYRDSPTPEPSANVDTAVLRAARQAVESRAIQGRKTAWSTRPFAWAGTAAVAVLALGLVYQARVPTPEPAADLDPLTPQVEAEPSAAAPVRRERLMTDEPSRDLLEEAAPRALQETADGTRADAAAEMAGGSDASITQFSAEESDARSASAKQAAADTGSAEISEFRQLAPAADEGLNDRAYSESLPKRYADQADPPRPEEWLDQIRAWKLVSGGEAVVTAELAAFRAAYPEHLIPSDLLEPTD